MTYVLMSLPDIKKKKDKSANIGTSGENKSGLLNTNISRRKAIGTAAVAGAAVLAWPSAQVSATRRTARAAPPRSHRPSVAAMDRHRRSPTPSQTQSHRPRAELVVLTPAASPCRPWQAEETLGQSTWLPCTTPRTLAPTSPPNRSQNAT